MYRIGTVYRYDSNSYDTYAEAEKQAKISSVGGREVGIYKEVARVLPEDSLTVTIKVD